MAPPVSKTRWGSMGERKRELPIRTMQTTIVRPMTRYVPRSSFHLERNVTTSPQAARKIMAIGVVFIKNQTTFDEKRVGNSRTGSPSSEVYGRHILIKCRENRYGISARWLRIQRMA